MVIRKFIAALFAPLLLTSLALADGLPSRSTIGVPYATAMEFKWTGIYLDAGGGYAWSGAELSEGKFFIDGVQARGWRGDGRVGFDAHLGSNFVAGLFAGYGFGSSELETNFGSAELTPTWHAGGRVGLSQGRTLWYLGGAWQQAELDVTSFDTVTVDGVKALAGVETFIAPQLTFAVEVGHTWYEDVNFGKVDVELTDLEAMARIRWRPTTGLFNN